MPTFAVGMNGAEWTNGNDNRNRPAIWRRIICRTPYRRSNHGKIQRKLIHRDRDYDVAVEPTASMLYCAGQERVHSLCGKAAVYGAFEEGLGEERDMRVMVMGSTALVNVRRVRSCVLLTDYRWILH